MSKLVIIKYDEIGYKAKDGERVYLLSDKQVEELKKYINSKYF